MLIRTFAAAAALLAPIPAAAQAWTLTEAARGVVRDYYAAIDRGDYRRAYGLWGDGGRASGQSYAGFVRGFARTAHTRVVAGKPYDAQGAAGSRYVTVPVTVDATLKNGTRQRFAGRYVLRRVNDVDGATPAQLRWHLAQAKLTAVRMR
jgi:hypothetical protein